MGMGIGGMGGISMAKMSGVGGSSAMSRSTTLSADGAPKQTKEQRRITREQAKVKRTIGAFAIWVAVYNLFCVLVSKTWPRLELRLGTSFGVTGCQPNFTQPVAGSHSRAHLP